jgi:hypothetical protein
MGLEADGEGAASALCSPATGFFRIAAKSAPPAHCA